MKTRISVRYWLIGSLIIQIVAFILAAITLGIGHKHIKEANRNRLSYEALILEMIVNAIQFIWYISVFCIYSKKQQDTNAYKNTFPPIWTRYIDWVLTTPIMLVSVICTMDYFKNEGSSHSLKQLFKNHGTDIFNILMSNFTMLIFGLMNTVLIPVPEFIETNGNSSQRGRCIKSKRSIFGGSFDNKRTRFCQCILLQGAGPVRKRRSNLLIWAGFVPFIQSWVTLALGFAANHMWLWITYIATFFIWAAYGICASFSEKKQNIAYTVLDIISKNMFSIILSITILRTK